MNEREKDPRPAGRGNTRRVMAVVGVGVGLAVGGAVAFATIPLDVRPTASRPTPSRETPALGEGGQQLMPGVHVLDLLSRDENGTARARFPKIAVTLPPGWFNHDGWALGNGEERQQSVFVTFWDVEQVYRTPCRWARRGFIDPGRGVARLAETLARQPLRHASAPRNIELAGFSGKYVELSVPAAIDFTDCDEGAFESWTGNGWSTDRYEQAPGQVDDVWILDVQGQRLVVDASYLPTASVSQRAELNRVVHSIRFLS